MTLTDLLPASPGPDAVFDAFAGWAKQRGLALYPHQEDALIEVVSGANVILSTPTGSGKSLVAAGAHFALGEMRTAARRLPAETAWQRQAIETVIDDLFALQSETALSALQTAVDGSDPLAAWTKERATALAPAEAIAAELRAGATPDLAMLVVASRQLRQALG